MNIKKNKTQVNAKITTTISQEEIIEIRRQIDALKEEYFEKRRDISAPSTTATVESRHASYYFKDGRRFS